MFFYLKKSAHGWRFLGLGAAGFARGFMCNFTCSFMCGFMRSVVCNFACSLALGGGQRHAVAYVERQRLLCGHGVSGSEQCRRQAQQRGRSGQGFGALQTPKGPEYTPDHTVDSLEELPDIFLS